ncbi:MAG: hypothetical protein ABIF40_00655 [archaeon]
MALINHLKELKFDEKGNSTVKIESVTSTGFSIDDVVVRISPVGPPVLGKRVHDLHSELWEIYGKIPAKAHAYHVNEDPAEWIYGRRQIEIESDKTRPNEDPLYQSTYYRPIQFYKIIRIKENDKNI